MPPTLDNKWWGWGGSEDSFRFASAKVFWKYLADRLGPLGSSPHVESLDDIDLPPSRLTPPELKVLSGAVGDRGVSTDKADRAVHSLGKAYVDLIRIRGGHIPHPTDAVVYPDSETQIETLLKLAQERHWVVIPFGGGTSVVGGVEPTADARPVVSLDLRQLNQILEVDAESRLATVQAGIFGPLLERQLNRNGFTLGHFPQSFMFSSLGGWIATRSAGQRSTKYGKIEDMVSSLRVLTPSGPISTPPVPAAAAGSDLLQILIGSEGAYGIVTQATVKLQPLPRHSRFPSFLFHSFEEGISAVRMLVQAGLRPTVVRLSDEQETELGAILGGMTAGVKGRLSKWWVEKKGFAFPSSALLVLGFESGADKSARELMETELRIAKELMKKSGGLPLGERPGKRWHRKQFELPHLRDALLDQAVMIDTLETATTWKNMLSLHQSVKQSLEGAIESEEEKPLVMTHLSHAYPDGASLYYTFMARQKPGRELAQWQRVKRDATNCILTNKGALSHHHGVGSVHRPWLRDYLGDLAARVLGSIKKVVDPHRVLNPQAFIETEEEDVARETRGSFSHRTRSENLERFVREPFDLAIIGGGITGGGIARDAALRGLKVALIEMGDFAGGTSSRSSKMVHGGLRYLKQLDIKLVKESLRERNLLLDLAPHLVRPWPYLIPSYKGQWEKLELQIGMIGYDALAASKSVPSYRKLSTEDSLREEPLLKQDGLRGGFVFYDCLVDDARLTLATIRSAAEHGAVVANYVKSVGLRQTKGAVTGVNFIDVLGNGAGIIDAKVVVNATGPWADHIRAQANGNGKLLRPTKGVHIAVLREKLNVRFVIVLFTQDHRTIFVVPSGEVTYIGTTDTDYDGPPEDVRAEPEDVTYLLDAVNEWFNATPLTEDDVTSTWAGLRPLLDEEGNTSSVSRDYKVAIADSGLVTVAGGKLTAHRSMAEAAVDEIVERFGSRFSHPASACRTAHLPLAGGDMAGFEAYEKAELKGLGDRWGLSPEILGRLMRRYGTDYLKILALGLADRRYFEPLSPGSPLLHGEVVYAVEDEMTLTLEDFMARRTELQQLAPDRGMSLEGEVARIMAKRLGWNETETRRQLDSYRQAVAKSMAFRASPVSV